MQRDGIKPLSGEPYYHVVLTKSNLSPRYQMGPLKSICLELPSGHVPTVLNYGGKSWDITYNGHNNSYKKFSRECWRNFAEDNSLKIGDACIFELLEKSKEKIIFQVQILRGDIPSKFLEIGEIPRGEIPSKIPETGDSKEDPIVIL